jgi:hypothetical protein
VRSAEHPLDSRDQATVTLHESAEAVADRVWSGMGVVEAIDDRNCLLHVGADTPSALVWMITSVDTDFTLINGPPALADALRAQATRCLHGLQAPWPLIHMEITNLASVPPHA